MAMEHRRQLLSYIIAQSAANVRENYPHGYMSLVKEQLTGATELHEAGLVVAYPNNPQPDGSFPVVPTDAGVKLNSEPVAPPATPAPAAPGGFPNSAPQQAPQPQQSFAVKIETGIPVPPARQRGFQSEGGSAVDRYGFANMPVGASFHVPPSNDPDKPIHRTFSSVVSQANAKLHPMHFVIREVDATDPGGRGARVWRSEDLTGERPTRTPRKAKVIPGQQGFPAPGAAAPAPVQGGAPIPSGFGAPGGFGQPSPAPGAAPGGFGVPGGFGAPPGFGG